MKGIPTVFGRLILSPPVIVDPTWSIRSPNFSWNFLCVFNRLSRSRNTRKKIIWARNMPVGYRETILLLYNKEKETTIQYVWWLLISACFSLNLMIPIFTKQFIATVGYKFKLRSSLQTSKEVRYRFFSYFYRREFASITGLVMGDNQLTDSGATLVAVCQMNSTNDVDRNMGICKDLINKAKSRGAKVKMICILKCFVS